MTDLEKKKTSGLPATDQINPFEEYGNVATARDKFLKFNKGDFLAGKENEEVPLGTQFVALMDDLQVGWVCWQDGAPIDKRMGLIRKGYQAPRRNELGDLDKANWERNDNNEPQDPWQFTNELPMRRVDTDEVYIFSTRWKGGFTAIGELAKAYGKEMRQRPNQYPVIALDASSYLHSDRAIGRVHVPGLNNIVGWVAKDGNDASGGDTPSEPPQSPPSDTTAKPAAASSTNKPAATKPAARTKPRF
jgi:hypothetical protein